MATFSGLDMTKGAHAMNASAANPGLTAAANYWLQRSRSVAVSYRCGQFVTSAPGDFVSAMVLSCPEPAGVATIGTSPFVPH
jgi:hypothetical protein